MTFAAELDNLSNDGWTIFQVLQRPEYIVLIVVYRDEVEV